MVVFIWVPILQTHAFEASGSRALAPWTSRGSVAGPQVDNRKLRPLATTGRARNPRMADVPTLAEVGVKDVTLLSIGGIAVPAGTPAPIVERISAAMQEAMQRADVRSRLEANGAIVSPADGRELTEDLVGDRADRAVDADSRVERQ